MAAVIDPRSEHLIMNKTKKEYVKKEKKLKNEYIHLCCKKNFNKIRNSLKKLMRKAQHRNQC